MKDFSALTLAIICSINVTAQNSDSSTFYFQKGVDEMKASHWLVASRYFDKAISFNSKNTEAYLENGRVNQEMRRINEASLNFTKAYELAPTNQEAIRELTSLYFNNRQFQKAIELAEKCKACAESDRIIAMSNYHLEEYGKAIPALQRVLSKNPADAEVTYTLGRTYLDMEEYKNAATWYEKAVALDSSKPAWLYELGLIYYNDANYKNAQKYFEGAGAKGYVKSPDYYENLGYAYLHAGDFEQGVKNLMIVLSKRPNNNEILSDIALAYYNRKQYDNALIYYQKMLEKNDKDAKALYMAGMTFQKKGDTAKGQAMCDKAIEMDPSLKSLRQKQMSAGL